LRNRYLDLLRATAIVRVVVYHVAGWSLLTIVFPAMPVMFALAGSLMAASIDRVGAAAVVRRLRRLLPALWLLTAIFVPAMLLTGLAWDWRILLWAMPLVDPPANEWGAQALSANWYLRDFLWFVLLSPAALWLFRRRPLLTLATPYAMLAAVEFAGWRPPVILRDVALYFGAWLLGFAHHDGRLRRLGRRRLLVVAATLATTGALWIWQHPGPRGYDLNDIPLGNALWAGAFILVMLGCAPPAERFAAAARWWHRPVTVLNSRALTIYLWHVPILTGATRLAERHGWPVRDGVGVAWRLAVVVALVAAAVACFGWVEDVAAGRRPVLVPGSRAPRPVAVAPDVPVDAARTDDRPACAPADGSACPSPPDPPLLALPALLELAAARRPVAGHGLRPGTRTPVTHGRRTRPRVDVRRRTRVRTRA
jgi:peptidoglycan/LPS O-acetylase OafA/YrhL